MIWLSLSFWFQKSILFSSSWLFWGFFPFHIWSNSETPKCFLKVRSQKNRRIFFDRRECWIDFLLLWMGDARILDHMESLLIICFFLLFCISSSYSSIPDKVSTDNLSLDTNPRLLYSLLIYFFSQIEGFFLLFTTFFTLNLIFFFLFSF